MRNLTCARLVLGLTVVFGAACERVSTLRLPNPAPDADLAFAVLYDGDEPKVVGEVLRRQAVYSGRYGLTGDGGLTATLFFLQSADLAEAARAVCDAYEEAAERVLCHERIDLCVDSPEGCWRAVLATDGCGAGLELRGDIPLETYAPADDRLERREPGGAPSVRLCGPTLHEGCPNRRTGYVLTEAGVFGCVAEARQVDCTVTVDATACGLPEISFEIDEAGAPSEVSAGACTLSPPTAASDAFDAPADFALTCGDLELDFRPQGDLLATMQCPRRGPATFETDAPSSGRILDAFARSTSGGPRLLLSGEGFDDCANYGCAVRGDACNTRCEEGCSTVLLLEGCTRDSWDPCTQMTEREACLMRCRSYCGRPRDAACYGETDGLSLTLSDPELPEQDRFRFDLDGDSTAAALGRPSVAALGGPWLAVLTRDQLDVIEQDAADRLTRRGRFATSVQAAGVVTWAENRLAWFGASGATLQVRTARLTRGVDAALELDPAIDVPDFLGADAAALGGRRGDWLFLARSSPRLAAEARDQIQVVALESGTVLPPVTVPGAVTALASLPQGAVLVGYTQPDGTAGAAVLEPGADRVAQVHPLPLLSGLQLRAFAPDPERCALELPSDCRIFVGFEPEAASNPAVVGSLSYDASDPSSLSMRPALRTTGAQTVSQVVVEDEARRVWAIAGGRNVLTPLRIEP